MTAEGRKAEDLINAITIYEDGSVFEDNNPNLHELEILNPKMESDHLFASTEYKLIRQFYSNMLYHCRIVYRVP